MSLALLGAGSAVDAASPPGLPVGWWDFGDMSKTDAVNNNDPIGSWTSREGNALALTAAGAARPTLKIVGGKPYAAGLGAQKMSVSSALLRITGDLTIVVAVRKTAGGSFGGIVGCQTNAATINQYFFTFTGHASVAEQLLAEADGTNSESFTANNANFALATWAASAVRRSASGKFVGPTGSDTFTPTITPTSNGSSVFTIFDRNGASALPLTGDIACVLIYASALSDGDIALARAYAGTRF